MQSQLKSQQLRAAAPARPLAVRPAAQRLQWCEQQHEQQAHAQRQQLKAALGAAALSVGLLLAPVQPAHAAAPQGLADLVRADFGFIDADQDGVISRDDLRAFNAGLTAEEGVPAIGDGQLDFSLRLFDLNQDGTLTSEELLRSLALDGAVDEDAVDSGVFKVFDYNNNGRVDAAEWQRGLGDLGAQGEGAKTYIFDRVDRLTSSNQQLDTSDFGTALILARTIILGY
ncbi:MAG: kinase-like protein [Monoraphidium minutum]|nr:MAG: kinase-like protein [Monoraphidium minutum]